MAATLLGDRPVLSYMFALTLFWSGFCFSLFYVGCLSGVAYRGSTLEVIQRTL
jgi:hypothetical protein